MRILTANPSALVIANNTFEAIQNVGMPESRIILSQCTIYLATSPKAIQPMKQSLQAQALVSNTGNLSVPMWLRNAPQTHERIRIWRDYKYVTITKEIL